MNVLFCGYGDGWMGVGDVDGEFPVPGSRGDSDAVV